MNKSFFVFLHRVKIMSTNFNKKNLSLAIVALTFTLTLVGCASTDRQPPAVYQSSNQCFELKTNLLERARVNNFFTFDFQLSKACVSAEQIEKIVFLADMPAHSHGMNTTPIVKKIGKNHYFVEGTLFHMPGDWRAQFEIYYDSKIEIIELDLDL